jgi:hypothetical protein
MRAQRTTLYLFVALMVLAGVATANPEPAAAASRPFCGIWWGSQPKSAGSDQADFLMEGRVGRHPCYDRLVFELYGPAAGVDARYVRHVPLAEGVPQPRGGARLDVRIPTSLPPASAFDGKVQADIPLNSPMYDVRGFRTFRDVTWGGVHGDGIRIGLGVRGRLPFRAFVLDGPGHRSRVVVDVAHRW